ncbi:helix-turn-helix domain-containing protein [Vallitalea maricola]|uniref:helix-turn-helix domain-containing protein n=1 Tax=Vallitalea maricola TaxID=3074433 RepID=UPI00336530B9
MITISGIGERFKKWRQEQKLSSTQISKDTGVRASTISDIETNKTIPSGKTLIPLYRNYKLPITYILTGDENSTLSDDKKTLLDIYDDLTEINKKIAMSEINHILEIQELKKEKLKK